MNMTIGLIQEILGNSPVEILQEQVCLLEVFFGLCCISTHPRIVGVQPAQLSQYESLLTVVASAYLL